ncbi:MFS transporter [Butyrivibrio sp. LC3010]|uniref:MFS transporter n=1 Tax=Butyrivibrio sp. LC3010 TaxID=1280680 RepID=UPI0004012BE7|nr:MFS transporter [Butyrivibrio sp. LC3010]
MDIRIYENVKEDVMVLGWPERICYGIGDIPIGIIMSMMASYLMIYMTNVAFLDMAILSTLIAVSKGLDGVSDILIGNIIDNTNSKYGKARVWILRICVPLAISLFLMFSMPPALPAAAKYVYFFVLYNLINTCLFTFMNIAHFSLLSLMTKSGMEHGMLSNISSLFTSIFRLIFNVSFVPLLIFFSKNPENPYTQRGFTSVILIMCAFIIIGSLVSVFGTKERREDSLSLEHKRQRIPIFKSLGVLISNKYWLTMIIQSIIMAILFSGAFTFNIYYCTYILRDPASLGLISVCNTLPGIAIKFLMPSIIRKFDNFGTFILGQFIGFIAAIGIFLSAPNLNIMIIFFMISGVGMGISMPSLWGVLADVIRFTEKKNGVFSAGIANAGISAANKIGAGAASVVLGFAMSAAGFNAANGMTQPDTVLRVITFFFIVAPLIGQSIAFITSSIIFNKNCEIRQLIAKDRK